MSRGDNTYLIESNWEFCTGQSRKRARKREREGEGERSNQNYTCRLQSSTQWCVVRAGSRISAHLRPLRKRKKGTLRSLVTRKPRLRACRSFVDNWKMHVTCKCLNVSIKSRSAELQQVNVELTDLERADAFFREVNKSFFTRSLFFEKSMI